jgi:hypothetical protein
MSAGSAHDFEVHQEDDVVAARSVALVGAVGIAIGAVAVVIAGVILTNVDGTVRPSGAGPGGPGAATRTISGIEQTPIWDTEVGVDLREKQRRALAGWGWADRDAGIATIPIDRAIDLVVSEEAP